MSDTDTKDWGHVVGWGENPEQELADLTDLFQSPGEWQERAVCAQTDPESFFPEKGGSTREAKRICLGCDVKDECLEYAMENAIRFGIWGGLSELERRNLRKTTPRAPRLTKVAIATIGQNLLDGMPVREIAERAGVHRSTIESYRRKFAASQDLAEAA
jgi:WhiB family redox-sensing transcriptional regulator